MKKIIKVMSSIIMALMFCIMCTGCTIFGINFGEKEPEDTSVKYLQIKSFYIDEDTSHLIVTYEDNSVKDLGEVERLIETETVTTHLKVKSFYIDESTSHLIVIYEDDSVKDLGKIEKLVENETITTHLKIKSFYIEDNTNNLIVVYEDNSIVELGKIDTTVETLISYKACDCKDKVVISNYMQVSTMLENNDTYVNKLLNSNKCKYRVLLCKEHDCIDLEYIGHNLVDYRIESTTTTMGEEGKICSICSHKQNVTKLPIKDHEHLPHSFQNKQDEENFIEQIFGKVPNPCTDIWYSNVIVCDGCGYYSCKENQPLGHLLSTTKLFTTISDEAALADRIATIKTKCNRCDSDYELFTGIKLDNRLSTDYLEFKNYSDKLDVCTITINWKPGLIINLDSSKLDRFDDITNKMSLTLAQPLLAYEYNGKHKDIDKNLLPNPEDVTLSNFENIPNFKKFVNYDKGYIKCECCGNSYAYNIIDDITEPDDMI